MKKMVLLVLVLIVVFSFFNCATTKGGIPKDAKGVYLKDVILGGEVMEIALKGITVVDPDIDAALVEKTIKDINEFLWENPYYKLYWIQSENPQVSTLSEKTAQVNASVILADFSLRYLAGSIKAAARDNEAENAVKQLIMEDENLTVSEKELMELKSKKLSDRHRKNLKESLIYMAVSVAVLAKAPENAKELLQEAKELSENPEALADSPTQVPKISKQLKSIIDNLNTIIKVTPDLVKDLNANITIVISILKNT